MKNNKNLNNYEYEVLDRLAKDFNLKRKDDFALGEVGNYLISIIKDKSGVNEVNIVFKKIDNEKKRIIEGYINSIKGKFNIAKYKVSGENLSIVIPKMTSIEMEYKLLNELINKITLDLKPIAKGEGLDKASKEVDELKKSFSISEEEQKANAKNSLMNFFTNRWVALLISVLIIIFLWSKNKNLPPMNYILPILTPFMLFFNTRLLSKEAIGLKLLILISILTTTFGLYYGTFKFFKVFIAEELGLTTWDIINNINRGFIYGDTLSKSRTIIPLFVGFISSILGSILTLSYAVFKYKHGGSVESVRNEQNNKMNTSNK